VVVDRGLLANWDALGIRQPPWQYLMQEFSLLSLSIRKRLLGMVVLQQLRASPAAARESEHDTACLGKLAACVGGSASW